MSGARSDSVWTGQDVSPGQVEAALRKLVVEKHAENEGYVPARALNMICVVDHDWSGEIANRLRGVGRYHASRTIVCAVEPGRDRIDARASVTASGHPDEGALVLLRELIVVSVGEKHVATLD